MAQEPSGAPARAPWTKIFTAFKVALDMKKLLLAAAGIFLTWAGWALIGWTFYGMHSFPVYVVDLKKEKSEDVQKTEWAHFKAKRASWNLLHELAGSPSDHQKEDAGDVAGSLEEYVFLYEWELAYKRSQEPVQVKDQTLEVGGQKWKLTPIAKDEEEAKAIFATYKDKKLTVQSLMLVEKKDAEKSIKIIQIGSDQFTTDGQFDKLKEHRDGAMTLEQIAAKADKAGNQKDALKKFQTHLVRPKIKKSGMLRISPWSEDRGANQYLIVAETLKSHGHTTETGSAALNWVFSSKALVLLEPLVKFLAPIVYLFDARAGFWVRLYLILIMVWTLAIWGFFGGAICRIAAVQVARNERISLREAIAFTRERYASYVAAPVFPLVLLAIFTLVLMIFGWLVWIPWFGEIFAGLFWPLVILIGFTMAIVMVGLVGWPLMIATVSTEGTDSFDALSRSYSYIYQAPWQYLWYNFLAVVYGAVLIFFIGFMASLMVFVGKWGVSSAAGVSDIRATHDREPSYLFTYAPTSYGWRDLLISSNTEHVKSVKVIAPDGREVDQLDFKPDYVLSSMNSFGAFLVSLWIYPFFLLVLGFGYSFFWSSSTIIYFLMRRYVDDTEMDEVHQDDEDLDDPFLKPAPAPAAAAAPVSKPGTVSLNVVEAPPAPPASYTADVPPPAPSEPALPPLPPPSENPPADGHP